MPIERLPSLRSTSRRAGSKRGGDGAPPSIEHKPAARRVRFKAEVARWAAAIKVRPQQIRLQRMTRRWASCSAGGRVSFNAELPAQPRRFRDFVIVHELLHLKVPNHGKLFKSLLKAYLPHTQAAGDPLSASF